MDRLKRAVIDRANSDAKFRDRLKADPSAAFKEAGVSVANGSSFEVIDRTSGEFDVLLGARTGVPEVDQMLERADKDAAFREALLRDPRSALEAHVGQKLPRTLKVRVREAVPNTIYIYLGGSQEAGRELLDEQLEAVSGGIAPILLGCLLGIGGMTGGFCADKGSVTQESGDTFRTKVSTARTRVHRSRRAARNQARANCQSRFTVAGETSRQTAMSSISRSAK